MALILDIKVNDLQIDKLAVVNTGHVKDGKHLYRIRLPEGYNHLDIYHDRKEKWTILVEKVLHAINNNESSI